MPKTEVSSQENQADRIKVETGGLFQEICRLYDPFHACFIPFPLSVVAQARVWRGRGIPDEKQLNASLKVLAEKGFEEGQVELLIAYCESAFRPIKAAELGVEALLPNLLFTRSLHWPPNSAGLVLLEADLQNQLKALGKATGNKWVLAAGATTLNIRSCPPLIAPWVVGVTVKRWLVIKKVENSEAETLAINLASVLLGRTVRPEELRHWESLLNTVEVSLGDTSKALLPGYLIDIGQRMNPNEMGWGTTVGTNWGPKDYVKSVPLDTAACEELAKAIQRGWSKQEKSKPLRVGQRRKQVAEAAIETEVAMQATCSLCKSSIELQSLYNHFKEAHGISRDEIEAEPTRQELRRTRTKEVLVRYIES